MWPFKNKARVALGYDTYFSLVTKESQSVDIGFLIGKNYAQWALDICNTNESESRPRAPYEVGENMVKVLPKTCSDEIISRANRVGDSKSDDRFFVKIIINDHNDFGRYESSNFVIVTDREYGDYIEEQIASSDLSSYFGLLGRVDLDVVYRIIKDSKTKLIVDRNKKICATNKHDYLEAVLNKHKEKRTRSDISLMLAVCDVKNINPDEFDLQLESLEGFEKEYYSKKFPKEKPSINDVEKKIDSEHKYLKYIEPDGYGKMKGQWGIDYQTNQVANQVAKDMAALEERGKNHRQQLESLNESSFGKMYGKDVRCSKLAGIVPYAIVNNAGEYDYPAKKLYEHYYKLLNADRKYPKAITALRSKIRGWACGTLSKSKHKRINLKAFKYEVLHSDNLRQKVYS